MRTYLLLATTALLAACGGGGTNSTPPPPSAPGGGGGTPAPTPAPTHTFAKPTETKTYVGVGGSQVFEYQTDSRGCCDQQAEIYAGNTTTIRNSGISLTYDPSAAVFTLKVTDPASGAAVNTTFQDPANRTDFGGAVEPQWGTPKLNNPNIAYLQAGDGTPRSPYSASGSGYIDHGDNDTPPSGDPGSSYQATSMFYLRPGTETQYVSLVGFARNALTFGESETPPASPGEQPTKFDTAEWNLTRGAFAFGDVTANNAVPKVGTGAYKGSMIASMVFNPTLDGQDPSGYTDLPTYFQWIEGTAALDVNFASSTFDFLVNGTVFAPQFDYGADPRIAVIAAGATFAAHGLGTINLVNFGGFKGNFDSASVGGRNLTIAGSAIDGAFYGPAAQEAGGAFHIVGGTPDERIDILGAFVGKK